MSTTTHHFYGPSYRAERTGTCPTCGKKTRRTHTFEQTVSPFNRRADGQIKTWEEVRVDVKAAAAAWDPPADIFEHEKCRDLRETPAPGGVEPIPPSALDVATTVARVTRFVVGWLVDTGIPFTGFAIKPRWGIDRRGYVADVGFRDERYLGLWARALGLDPIRVERHDGTLYVRMSEWISDEVKVAGTCTIHQGTGPAWGGANIEWGPGVRGRRSDIGTIPLDDLLDAVSRMGIAQYTRNPS